MAIFGELSMASLFLSTDDKCLQNPKRIVMIISPSVYLLKVFDESPSSIFPLKPSKNLLRRQRYNLFTNTQGMAFKKIHPLDDFFLDLQMIFVLIHIIKFCIVGIGVYIVPHIALRMRKKL
jgi:hypothetical protein